MFFSSYVACPWDFSKWSYSISSRLRCQNDSKQGRHLSCTLTMTTTRQMSTAARSPRSCTPPFRKGWYVEDGDLEEDVQGEPQRSEDASAPRSKRSARLQFRGKKRRRKISETSSVSTAVRRRVDDALRQIRVLPIEATTPTCAVTLACPDASTLYLEPDTPSSVVR